jgi:hypothetical protein
MEDDSHIVINDILGDTLIHGTERLEAFNVRFVEGIDRILSRSIGAPQVLNFSLLVKLTEIMRLYMIQSIKDALTKDEPSPAPAPAPAAAAASSSSALVKKSPSETVLTVIEQIIQSTPMPRNFSARTITDLRRHTIRCLLEATAMDTRRLNGTTSFSPILKDANDTQLKVLGFILDDQIKRLKIISWTIENSARLGKSITDAARKAAEVATSTGLSLVDTIRRTDFSWIRHMIGSAWGYVYPLVGTATYIILRPGDALNATRIRILRSIVLTIQGSRWISSAISHKFVGFLIAALANADADARSHLRIDDLTTEEKAELNAAIESGLPIGASVIESLMRLSDADEDEDEDEDDDTGASASASAAAAGASASPADDEEPIAIKDAEAEDEDPKSPPRRVRKLTRRKSKKSTPSKRPPKRTRQSRAKQDEAKAKKSKSGTARTTRTTRRNIRKNSK